jgi:malonate transporter
MLETILGALLPIVVTFLLGFVAAWRRDFGPKDAAILNRMVLLSLLGHASGGVALFASGIVLASRTIKVNGHVLFLVFLKNIVQPALVLGGLRWLDYGNPIVSQAVLTAAIPSMPMVILLAVQYRAADAEVASAVLLSVIGSVITMGAFIALTS